jgi:hypothetical protein
MGVHFQEVRFFNFDFIVLAEGELEAVFSHGPGVDSEGAFGSTSEEDALEGAEEERGDMTVSDGEFGNKVFALVFVQNHVLLSGTSDKQVSLSIGSLCLFTFFLRCNPIIIRDTIIGAGLLMFVAFLIMIVLIVHGIVQTKAIDISRSAGGNDMRVIEGDDEVLHKVGQGEEVEGFVVDGVVDEDVLLFVDGEEVAAVAVLDDFAVGDLDVF